ncbi:hypothetical protein ING2E5B_0589 [Fermentimonas caenicola]|uniref:Uncharacterized protein n=1 Tax=Fermentimonas caenicola TaxID=1562970 RepID=A0A098BYV4_9BACT|nr:hypothetical protein ING2E5B_0589 [Fermentimonas caenicola]
MAFAETVYQRVCYEGTQRCGETGHQESIEHGTFLFHAPLEKESVGDDPLGKLMNHQSCCCQKTGQDADAEGDGVDDTIDEGVNGYPFGGYDAEGEYLCFGDLLDQAVREKHKQETEQCCESCIEIIFNGLGERQHQGGGNQHAGSKADEVGFGLYGPIPVPVEDEYSQPVDGGCKYSKKGDPEKCTVV